MFFIIIILITLVLEYKNENVMLSNFFGDKIKSQVC